MEYTIEVLESNVRCFELALMLTGDEQLKTLITIRLKETEELLTELKKKS